MSRSWGATAENVTGTVNSDEVVETGLIPDTQTDVEVVNTGLETPNERAECRIVTATVTAGTEATGGGGTPPTAKDFLLRVVPWPVNQMGHVNLHYSMVSSRGGKDIVTG